MFRTWHVLGFSVGQPLVFQVGHTASTVVKVRLRGLTAVPVQQNYLEVKNEYWSQVEDTAMGLPISILSPKSCKTLKDSIIEQWQTGQKVLIELNVWENHNTR